jgi:transcriptional regulator with XRE-family HTH domain
VKRRSLNSPSLSENIVCSMRLRPNIADKYYTCGSDSRSKIQSGYQSFQKTSQKGLYAEPRMNVKKKTRLRVNAEARPEIARAFRAARQSLGMSQDELAKAIGSVQDTISRWERNKDRPPVSALIALTELLPEGERAWWQEITGHDAKEKTRDKSLDSKLLARVLEAVEVAANEAGVILPRLKYAEIVAEVYDVWRKTGQNKPAIVERLIGHVCEPSEGKVKYQ